jgi:hypothetical protein
MSCAIRCPASCQFASQSVTAAGRTFMNTRVSSNHHPLAQLLHYVNYFSKLHRKLESAMLATAAALTINPLFLRHDLMIELGRLEMAIEDVRSHHSANDHQTLTPLETKLARINEALTRLSA